MNWKLGIDEFASHIQLYKKSIGVTSVLGIGIFWRKKSFNEVLGIVTCWYLLRSVVVIHLQNFAQGTTYYLISIF